MKTFRLLFFVIALITTPCLSGCSSLQENKDVLFQTSTYNALIGGIYDGDVTYRELRKHGDLGIGTFNGLDGEMIFLDGTFYQIKADGLVYPVDDMMKSPFASVTFFKPDNVKLIDKVMDSKQVEQYLDNILPTKNIFYAFKIEGDFKYLKTRSVPKQGRPYPPINEVIKTQPEFEFHNIRGTMVGFRCPEYVKGINFPGYHLHFITEDRKAGGHVLVYQVQNAKIEIDYTPNFFMVLPPNSDFYNADLTK
jgi:acetolactate decarboxylase